MLDKLFNIGLKVLQFLMADKIFNAIKVAAVSGVIFGIASVLINGFTPLFFIVVAPYIIIGLLFSIFMTLLATSKSLNGFSLVATFFQTLIFWVFL